MNYPYKIVEKPASERLVENVQMQGFRNPEESPPKGGICESRTEKYAAVTCPVK
jgi:hypothetical protein